MSLSNRAKRNQERLDLLRDGRISVNEFREMVRRDMTPKECLWRRIKPRVVKGPVFRWEFYARDSMIDVFRTGARTYRQRAWQRRHQADATKYALFLQELAELTRQHGFEIGGCGCCGSPWISDLEKPEGWYEYSDLEGLRWTDEGF